MIMNTIYFSQYQAFHDELVIVYYTTIEPLKIENPTSQRFIFLGDNFFMANIQGAEKKILYSGELD